MSGVLAVPRPAGALASRGGLCHSAGGCAPSPGSDGPPRVPTRESPVCCWRLSPLPLFRLPRPQRFLPRPRLVSAPEPSRLRLVVSRWLSRPVLSAAIGLSVSPSIAVCVNVIAFVYTILPMVPPSWVNGNRRLIAMRKAASEQRITSLAALSLATSLISESAISDNNLPGPPNLSEVFAHEGGAGHVAPRTVSPR